MELPGSRLAKEMTIGAKQGWQPTGIVLAEGQPFAVKATGLWNKGFAPDCGPDGYAGWTGEMLHDSHFGTMALLARVGEGAPFFAGSFYEGKASGSGDLQFRPNVGELGMFDNSGGVGVQVYLFDNVQSSGAESVDLPKRTCPQLAIAVAELSAFGIQETEAQTLTENLRSSLVDTGYFTVASRNDMLELLNEQHFQRAQSDDTQSIVHMGRILSVRKMVSGSVGKVGETFTITVQMVDVETGKIDCAVTQSVQGRSDALLSTVWTIGRRLSLKYAQAQD